jgi:hypothetical protein
MAKMVELAKFVDRSEAIIARGLLESEDIVAVIPDMDTLGVAPHLVFATGGYRLLVSEHQLDDARALLEEIRRAAAEPDPDATSPSA